MPRFFSNSRLVDDTITNDDINQPQHSLYQDALRAALLGAQDASPHFDTYRVENEEGNGWHIVSFAHGNGLRRHNASFPNETLSFRPAHATILVNGTHGKAKVYFTNEDSEKILDEIQRYHSYWACYRP
jgi:hypothetical protein